ncbi:hypothetical protein CROQUDRAFT_665734 [Cronartium quercuum f. sp. fusiforme G11]|uniref:Uncharacterized protein n=1 Tax=Cronartium quercuum f. sp. fusiforme G11 TaxID=708437 RepID=A0A9P6NA40_9BASI|nr:hypothetical protein CROQUDRAFT_665734 [Cronartium quercuum f. sp. fusiforme G11]
MYTPTRAKAQWLMEHKHHVSRIRCDGITLQYGVRALDTDSNSIAPNPTDTASHLLG